MDENVWSGGGRQRGPEMAGWPKIFRQGPIEIGHAKVKHCPYSAAHSLTNTTLRRNKHKA